MARSEAALFTSRLSEKDQKSAEISQQSKAYMHE